MPAKVDVVVKVNERPTKKADALNGAQTFAVDSGAFEVTFTLKPKVAAKFDEAEKKGTPWVAAITGKLGPRTEFGFEIVDPQVQVFDVKPRA